ncbi:efflux transporter outer membrane subunit [Pararobbsia silviterrae]|uniref:Efflux transporter outer membrane subunit n=1 Tax=Pararobbsia silviterrae TaxID=1792498 RepID=A0A494X0E1_9BURK|nr:efflux transporter outer membrane subunit [Pararobbsia silviterrae]RKP44225.1 efflux transporter outer membrane subunit [Pararobbsia silviterrae]
MNAVLRHTAVGALLLCAAACTLGPNYEVPKDAAVRNPAAAGSLTTASGKEVSDADVPSDWWHLYDDPALNQLVEDALRSNTNLRVAAANIARASFATEAAEQAGGFSGKTDAAVLRAQESGEAYLLTEKVPVVNEGDFGIAVSYQLDLFGQIRRGVEASAADQQAAQAAADVARITVVADVVRSYVENCAAGDELNVAQHSLDLQNQSLALTKRLRDAGRANEPEVTRSQTQTATLSADIPRFTARKRVALYRLAMLTGRAPNELPPEIGTCDKLPRLRQAIPVGDGAALLRRRPDIRESERKLAAATARIGVATASLYPNISIGASAGFTGVLEDIPQSATARWNFGPLISWNFPINGQRERVHEAEASASGALASFDGVVLNALRETESELATYSSDLAREDALKTARASASKTADQTHRLYLAGRQSSLADLDAMRTLASVDGQVAGAEAAVSIDQVDLFLALGGGWEQTPPATASSEAPPQPASAPAP